jgi:ketosteroid isomerase-like protein
MAPDGVDAVSAFIDAFNSEDLDALVAVCDPQVEIQTSRGIVIGPDEARRWATRNPHGDLQQRLVLEELREDDHRAHVVAMVRRQWYWRARPGEVAHEEELTIVSTIRDGRIARWRPFEDRAEALRAAGLPGSV